MSELDKIVRQILSSDKKLTETEALYLEALVSINAEIKLLREKLEELEGEEA